MKIFRQIGAVLVMNLRSVPQRLGASLVIVVGIAGVVAVLVSVLAMSTGMVQTMANAGRDDRAIILRRGSAAETSSALPREAARLIGDTVGVKRDTDGKPILSAETFGAVIVHKQEDGAEANVTLRGVGPKSAVLRPEFRIVAGRIAQPAVAEIMVGRAASRQFRNLDVGDSLRTRGADWKIVGVFTTGDAHESEMFTDVEVLNAANRGGGFHSITVQLESAGAFNAFRDALMANPALSVDVTREREYYTQQSKRITQVINVIAYVVGGIMAIGAVFSALNTMYGAVSARRREIATLRALGFGATAMVLSVLLEALVLSLLGASLGATLAWLVVNGHTVSTVTGAGAHLVFDLTVSSHLLVVGIVWACLIGGFGGLLPALRSARAPVATALRAT